MNTFLYAKTPEGVWDHVTWVVSEFLEKTNVKGALEIVPQSNYIAISILNTHRLSVDYMFFISDNLDELKAIRDLIDPDNCIIEEKIVLIPEKLTAYVMQGTIVAMTIAEDLSDEDFDQALEDAPFPVFLHGCSIDMRMLFEYNETV